MIPDSGLASFEWQQFGLEVGSSAVVGAVVGFAMKKVAKIMLVVTGIVLALLIALEAHDVIKVYWDTIDDLVVSLEELVHNGNPSPEIMNVVTSLAIGGGFAGGFLIGFKRA